MVKLRGRHRSRIVALDDSTFLMLLRLSNVGDSPAKGDRTSEVEARLSSLVTPLVARVGEPKPARPVEVFIL